MIKILTIIFIKMLSFIFKFYDFIFKEDRFVEFKVLGTLALIVIIGSLPGNSQPGTLMFYLCWPSLCVVLITFVLYNNLNGNVDKLKRCISEK